MKRLLITLIIAAVFMATSAQAEEKKWYGSGNLGLTLLSDADNEALGIVIESGYDLGFNIGGAVGYNFGNIRTEGELTYHTNSVDTLSVFGLSAPADGTASALSFMVNGYYDFHSKNSSMVPYLGVGIGYANVDLDASVVGTQLVDDSAGVFAYQFMAGLGFNINKTTTLTAGYRYFATSGLEFNDPSGFPFDSEYQAHEFNFGARFMF